MARTTSKPEYSIMVGVTLTHTIKTPVSRNEALYGESPYIILKRQCHQMDWPKSAINGQIASF